MKERDLVMQSKSYLCGDAKPNERTDGGAAVLLSNLWYSADFEFEL